MSDDTKKPAWVFVDGIDGTGKTTLLAAITTKIASLDPERPVLQLRLPEDVGRAEYRTIIKKGPRTPVDTAQAAAYAMEDALLNVACFVRVMDDARRFLADNPTGIVLCDRSLESINCYQNDLFKNPAYSSAMGLLRDELFRAMTLSWTFVLKPPEEFIVSNLTSGRAGDDDAIDDIIVKKATEYRDLYRDSGRYTRIMTLRNPNSYLDDVINVLTHQSVL